MKKLLAIIILLSMHFGVTYAQSADVKYFGNENLTKEVTKEKAKFSKAIIQNADSSVTTEVKNLKTDMVIRSETWKGKEPFGIWITQTGKGPEEMDYSFKLIYTNGCPDSIRDYHLIDPFKDDNDAGYKSPKLSTSDSTISLFLVRNIRYPAFARENGIEGRILVTCIITETGTIENAYVAKGVETTLDKEAVRVIRKMKFLNPPTIQGQPQKICVKLPITFRLS